MSGVAVWIHRKVGESRCNVWWMDQFSDQVIVVRLNAKPRNISLIQVCVLTTSAVEEEMTCVIVKQVAVPNGTCCW